MYAEIWCTHCNRKLRVQQTVLGKKVRCPGCMQVFVAEDIPVVEPVAPPAAPARSAPPPAPVSVDPAAISPQPIPVPRPVSAAANPHLPANGPQRPRPVVAPADDDEAPADFPPVEFKAVVKTDPDKQLKGIFTASVTSDGLHLRQGKKRDLLLPVGTPAQYLEGNRFIVEIDGREVTFMATKFGAYQARLARDVVKFLKGRKRVLYREDYPLEWYLFVPAVLPLGIPILTLGGAIPFALGFGLSGGCMAIAQLDRLSKGTRIALSLTLGFVGYVIIIVLIWAAFSGRWGWGRRAEAQVPNVAPNWGPPPAKQEINPDALAEQGWRDKRGPGVPEQEWRDQRVGGQPPIEDRKDPNAPGPKIDFKILPKLEEKKVEQKPLLASRLLQFPGAKALAASFSPDGKVLVVSGDSKGATFWDPATGKQLGTAPGQTKANFTRDGKRVVLSDNQTVRQWDLATGKVLPEAFAGQRFGLSADGRKLVVFAAKDKDRAAQSTVRCYDLATGRLEGSWQTPQGRLTGFGVAPDGRSIALSLFIDRLEIHDAVTGALRVRCQPQVAGGVFRPVYAPDGKKLAASAHGNSVVSLYDAGTGQVLRSFEEPSRRPPWMLAFSPDGKKLAAGVLNGVLRIWDVSTGKSLAELKVDDAADAWKPGLDHAIWDVQISPDGRYLAATASGMVRIWDAAPLLQVAANDIHLTGTLPPNPNFNPTAEELARARPKEAVKPPPKEVVKLPPKEDIKPQPKDPPKGGLTATATIPLPKFTNPRTVAFSPNGKLLALAGDPGPSLWDVATRTELARLQTQRITNMSVAFSDDGKLLAAGDIGGTVKIWDVETRQEKGRVQYGRIFIMGLRFLPGGHTLAIGANGIVLRDVDTDALRSFPFPGTRLVDSVAVSQDGKILAGGSFRGEIRLWDVASGAELGKLQAAHKGVVFALAFSPDGKTLASGGGDRQIHLWDVATRAKLATLSGHADAVSSLAFTPDGKLLAAATGGVRAGAGRSGELKVWDVAGRRMAADLRGHTNGVTAVSVASDGRTLVSVSLDNTLRLWDLTQVTVGAAN